MDEQVFLCQFPEFFVGRRVLLLFGVFALLHRPTLAVRCEYAHHLWPCSWPVPVEDTSTSPSVVSVAKDNDSNASARCCGICAFICAQKDTGVELGSLHLLSRMSHLWLLLCEVLWNVFVCLCTHRCKGRVGKPASLVQCVAVFCHTSGRNRKFRI